ncbi:MAG: sensor histidine kinase/response regulator hybrid protein [Verrucomicrobiaceae bacterium]|nr:sensor histidine kinase/response regulator hybrid protein [Verrucomicrobiaceae bacterium]
MANLTEAAEAARLQTLASYAILDTPPEVDLDNLTQLAAEICATPIAIISLVDATRQWFKARVGIEARETPREISFCAHVLAAPHLLEVEDARLDPRFSNNPLLTTLNLRFYAGTPLIAHDGSVLGTLAVIDRAPRRLSDAQRRALAVLTRQVMQQLELRRQLRLREEAEHQLHARLYQQAMVAELGLKAVSASELDKLLPDSLAQIAHTLDIEHCALLQLIPEKDIFLLLAGFGWPASWTGVQHTATGPELQPGYTLRAGASIYVPDYRDETRFAVHPGLSPAGVISGMSVPIRLHNRDWGVLTVHSHKARGFSADDAHFLQAVATLLATTIDRLATQQLLLENEQNMRSAQQIAHVGNWDVDRATGHFRWSEELYRIFGLDPALVAAGGESFFSLVHHGDREAMRNYVDELKAGRLSEVEYRIVWPNGETRYLRERGGAVKTSDGEFQRLLGTVVDVTEIKKATLALQENAALLEIASSSALLGGWKLDLETRRLFWSDAVRRIYGVPMNYEPNIETSILAYAPEYTEKVRADVAACIADGTPFDFEVELINHQQRRVWVRATGRALRDVAGTITEIHGAFQDISERKKSEAQINLLAGQLETTLENITDAFFTLDHDWRFTYLNKRAEQLVQRSRQSLLGENLVEQFEGIQATNFYSEYQRAIDTDETVSFVDYYPPLDSWFDVTAYPTPDGLAVYFRKVNDRVFQERQLRQQALLLDQAKDAILVRDLEHRLLFWNKAAERLYGWSKDETLGQSVEPLLYSANATQFRAATQAVLDRGEWSGRLQQLRRDGTAITVEGHWTLVRDDAGQPQSILSINSDISDRLELEKRLAQSQKLEAIGQLTGGIAHDFNNLLTVIIGNIELLAEEISEDDPNAPIIELISTAADRGAQLTARLLSFARRQTLEPRVVSPQAIIDDLVPLLRQALGEAVEIELFHEPDLWAVAIDPAQLESALLNLCINARDAMPGGGKLTIETANVALDESYVAQHPEATSGHYVQVVVTDNGTGIDAANLAQVFDPFFTTKEKGKGTGLGLSMVYGFVKQSGGHIKIYSEVGQGTAIHLYLPEGLGTDAKVPMHAASVQQEGGSEHILLVEDDELVRNHAARLLRDLGYSVSIAGDGIAALGLIRQGHKFDLLFTDVIMPGGLNGPQLAAEARKLLPQLPVLYTSGYTENAVVHHGKAEAGILLLHKPYRRQALAKKVRQALEVDNSGGNL